MEPLLMVFLRAPVKGRVKTRLAATLGDDRALEIYQRLLHHTLREADALDCTKQAWYADAMPEPDPVAALGWATRVQCMGDLGQRMQHAFHAGFGDGFSPIIIIGTDLPQLSSALLAEAFAALKDHDAVIGPANDGGYYLLGLNAPLETLFTNKQWSTATVLSDTIADLLAQGRSYTLLPELVDVDTEADLDAVDLP